jgi:hypothetical protein
MRDGALAIDLVDRQELAALLKRYALGVKTVVVRWPDKNLFDNGRCSTVGVCFKTPAAPPSQERINPHDPGWARSSSSTVSPLSYTDTVPDEAEITTAVASVTVVMASAAA